MNPPENWGNNHLSKFIELARGHTFEVISTLKPDYELLVQIDSLFKLGQENLNFTKEWFAALFFMRAHSSFLCATNIALCGQLPEAYMVLRGCIENSLYGLYFSRHEKDVETWLRRDESDAMKQQVRNLFKYATLISFLKEVDPKLGNAVNSFYESTIDLGAHPNELSLTSALRREEVDSKIIYRIAYISGEPKATQLCLKTTAQVGVLVLSVFRNVFKERFDILGITTELDKLKLSL